MEQVIMNLALQYAKSRGLSKITDKALEYAYETLGIEQEEEDYTGGGIYGIKNAFNPKNLVATLGRNVLNNAAKKSISSGMLGPVGLMAGALMLGRTFNPTRPGSRNYNPNLQGQIDYATRRGYIGTNPGTGLQQYGPTSALAGQNVQSMFGTNDYQQQLANRREYFENRIALGKPISQKNYERVLAEEADLFEEKQTIQENYRTGLQGAGGNVGTTDFTEADDNRESYGKDTGGNGGTSTGRGREEDDKMARGGRAGYFKGGIASLWQR